MTELTPTQFSAAEPPIETRISSVGKLLADSFQGLLDGTDSRPSAPKEVSSTFGMNAVFSQRLAAALRRNDPLATVQQIPGPEPLRKLVKAARKKGVPQELIARAEKAIDDFDHLIRKVAGDRSGLDAIISTWLPEARARVENDAKQAVYRGMRQLRGISTDTLSSTLILHPGADSKRLDVVTLTGHIGLRCVRPGAPLNFKVNSWSRRKESIPRTLDDRPLHECPEALLLESFSSPSPVKLALHQEEDSNVYTWTWGNSVGIPSACDLVIAELRRGLLRQFRTVEDVREKAGITHRIEVPAKAYVFDLLLHPQAYPDWVPNISVLDLPQGTADPNSTLRRHDEYDIQESIESLGTGIQRFRSDGIPRYGQLLEYVCNRMGWNPVELRGYRARIDYPICGSHVGVTFDVPVVAE